MANQKGFQTDLAILSKDDVFEKVKEYKPDMILCSVIMGEHKFYSEINRKIKTRYKGIFTIMGRSHVSSFSEVLKEANLDTICIGEWEYSFIEFLDRLMENKDIHDLENMIVQGEKPNKLKT